MKIIAIKDSKDRGYTVFHADFPSVITQVENLEDAKPHLAAMFHDIIMHTPIEEKELKEVKL